MALDDNGPLKFSELQTEFGDQDSQPAISLGEYYRNGPNVPTTRTGSSQVSSWTRLPIIYRTGTDDVFAATPQIRPLYIMQGIVFVERYWRDIDVTDGDISSSFRVGNTGRGFDGQAFGQAARDNDVALWFWEGQLEATITRGSGDWSKSRFIRSSDGTGNTLGWTSSSGNTQTRQDDDAVVADNTNSLGSFNPFGGSYKVNYGQLQRYRTSTVSTSTNINTKIPLTNEGAITLPDDFYGGTNT